MAHRRRQAEGLPEDAAVDVSVNPAEFLATVTVRQLKLLKAIAMELDPEIVH